MEGLSEYLKLHYEQKATEWKHQEGDRKRFSDIYFSMQEGLRSVIGNTNLYVKIAIHFAVAEDERRLKKILERNS